MTRSNEFPPSIRAYLPRGDVPPLVRAFDDIAVAKLQLAQLPLIEGRERPGLAQLASAPAMMRRSIMRAIGPAKGGDQ